MKVKRSLIEANGLSVFSEKDHRRALMLASEIETYVRVLTDRLKQIEQEMQAVSYRTDAISAYCRTVTAARKPDRAGTKGDNR